MRIPLTWLADYVDLDLPAGELAHKLTMAGLKVESVEYIGQDWRDVVIGQVIEIEPHPASRKPLWVTKTDLGDRVETIVTGAPNARLNDKIPVVPVGGVLPIGPDGGPMVIEPRPMAGITSRGMLASARELGISDEHEGLFILPQDAPVGMPLRSYMGDDVLEIETNPNRPDTLSVIGIAREVAAITQQQLTLPDLETVDGVEWLDEESIRVEVTDPDLCPRYSALRLEGVQAGEAPFWMRRRLELAGMRSISLLVDITNYVMLEYGQPMHAFDLHQLHGGKIVVRRADEGDRIHTLDGVERVLVAGDLVIADGAKPVAIAGVMGGENSEIGTGTTDIVLESATFEPISVRRTAKRLDLRTEASARFEKSLPPETTVLGLKRYLQLLTGCQDAPLRAARISDVWVGPPEPRTVTMPMRDLDRLLGIEVPRERAAEILSLLGFDVLEHTGSIAVVVPFWRRADIALSADLVEEVARIVGFDDIPSTLPQNTVSPPPPLPELFWESVVREQLLSAGASELVTHSLTSPAAMDRLFGPALVERPPDEGTRWSQIVPNAAGVYAREALTLPVALLNPPNRERTVLRLTLGASLLDEIGRNLRHTEDQVALFEVARTYFRRPADLPYERRTLTVALSGRRHVSSWQEPVPPPYSYFDLKGIVESVLDALGIEGWHVEARAHPSLHPGRAAVLCLEGHDVGYLGEVHPSVAAGFEIEGWPVQLAEIDLDTLFAHAKGLRLFRPIPRFPAARRDVAVLLAADVPAAEVVRVVREAGGDLLESARIFDVYQGDPLPSDRKSIAVAMEFRSPGATLTQEEVAALMARIVDALSRELQATLRE